MDTQKNSTKFMKFVTYMIVVVLVNIAGLTLFFRLDLTSHQVYSLSGVSKKVVSTLSEPLTINVFFTRNLPAPYNTVERYLNDLLDEYALYGGRNFNYRFYDVTPEEEDGSDASAENRRLARDYGVPPVQIQAIEKDEVKFKKAYMGLVILHGDMMERIPTITSTDGLEYGITTSIMKMNNKISALLKLSEPIEVRLYMSPNLTEVGPQMGLKDLPQLSSKVGDIVERLNRKMYDRLTYSTVQPSDRDEVGKAAKDYGLMHFKWNDLEGTDVKAGEGVIGIVLEHGKSRSVLPLIQAYRIPLFGPRYNLFKPEEIEEMISQNVESLIGINENIGYLADHGTLQTSAMPGTAVREPISSFDQIASQNYSIKQVSLTNEGIPKGLKSLVIAGPTEKFSDYELYQIDQALMQGTNLALFIDRFQEVQYGQPGSPYGQQSQFLPLDTGLGKLLEHYGVKINESIVLDEKCYRARQPIEYGGGEQSIYFAPLIQGGYINNEPEFMRNVKSLIMLAVSPVEIDAKRISENGVKAVKLVSSSDRSWEMKGTIVLNPSYMRPPTAETEMKSRALAYLLEGTFKSYFAGKPVPERPSAEDAGEAPGKKSAGIEESSGFLASSKKPGKIFVISSSQILTNNMIDKEADAGFVLNMLDVLNDRLDISRMRSKTLTINPLMETQARTKVFLKTLNIAIVPALVVLAGLAAWLRRRYRKSRIEYRFARRAGA